MIEIDTKTGLYTPEGNALELVTFGETATELMENAAVFEMDCAGNEIVMHDLADLDDGTFRRAAVIIANYWIKAA